jgi:hypothetical protein
MVTIGLMYMLILRYLGIGTTTYNVRMALPQQLYYSELTTYVRACEKSKQVET